ncbi:multifunctional CCA addition/repair protein [Legionella spiritensis]|uniref:multifunctional CCA addition/repair protein n=1 Tax=Legionella spiritensis TaxID=452 RepID=UPI000F6DF5DF|nr:multifunctional CCA addition/repair protein [Legionella spiritensis]VEG91854.1 tRNA nucleotidyltransferase [Legionella spiritensis]
MKVYLVGGAVRDRLLGYPVKERDWVVVGATPQQMRQQGYQQVGRDFPVFLHPETGEEYALARTERKSAPGYHGFVCHYDSNVTLEEDLMRRDLTINAMAMDENGTLIDPYQGARDLRDKQLRHVSDAFGEDPVRVLRTARFAARYHHLGFRVHHETRLLMYLMVRRRELHHLVAERVWQEWQRSLTEKNPEVFLQILRGCGALAVVLPELDALFGVPNPRQHHPEVDSGVHTLMVLQAAAALSDNPQIRFAAVVHDLGKALTPLVQWPKHRGHEESGVPVVESLCHRLRIPVEYRRLAVLVSRYHLLVHRVLALRVTTMVTLLEKIDAFRRPQGLENLLIACEADAKGRGMPVNYRQGILWRQLYDVCAQVSAQTVIQEGYQGAAIKKELHQRRVLAIQPIIESWENHERQQ